MASLTRILYLIAMYTGIRAASNQARSFLLPRTRASALHGSTLQLEATINLKTCVNSRLPPEPLASGTRAGMISVHLTEPDIPRLVYWMLRLTSHFGNGHIEIAFYEDGESIVAYAVRNIIRSNIDRLGLGRFFRRLQLGSNNDEILAVQQIFCALHSHGIHASFAPPETCIQLAINQSLLNPLTRHQTTEAMIQRYERIVRRIEKHNNTMHTEPDLRVRVDA